MIIFMFFFLRFSLPGPILALENHGFAKEILGKSLKIHEFPRKSIIFSLEILANSCENNIYCITHYFLCYVVRCYISYIKA